MNRKSGPLHKKNSSNPPRGRKPILTVANRKKIVASSGPIKQTLTKIIGSGLSSAARAVIGSVFGSGDYTVKSNSLTGSGGPPQFSSNGNHRSVVVSHREFVQDITGTTAFTATSFPITPTNNSLFPWLSQIAANFEEYRIHGMLFEFKTTSGMSVSSTNTALGTVIMASQYNPNDPVFQNKIEMENYEFATTGGPFQDFLHPLECKPALTVAPQLYVSQPASSGAVIDLRLTNFGTFNIATTGMQASNVVGELWVSYMVELLKPRISSVLVSNGSIFGTFNSNVSNTNVFGTAASVITSLVESGSVPGERNLWSPSDGQLNNTSTTSVVGTPAFYPQGITFNALSTFTLPSGINFLGRKVEFTLYLFGTGITALSIIAGGNGTAIGNFGTTSIVSTDQTLRVLHQTSQIIGLTTGLPPIFTVTVTSVTVTACLLGIAIVG